MTGAEFRAGREALGLTAAQAGRAWRASLRTIQSWEWSERKVPGPAGALMRVALGSAEARVLMGLAEPGG